MNSIELRTLPSKVVFTIWLQHMLHSKRARFSKSHSSVILLNSGVSSMFALGRHVETNHPIIAVPRPMMPWMFMGDINQVIIEGQSNLYIEFGEPTSPFYLAIKCSKNRIRALLPRLEDTQDLVKTVDFHGYIVTNGEEAEITKALSRAPILMVNSFSEHVPPTDDIAEDLSSALKQDFDIYNPDNFDKLEDPLIF